MKEGFAESSLNVHGCFPKLDEGLQNSYTACCQAFKIILCMWEIKLQIPQICC